AQHGPGGGAVLLLDCVSRSAYRLVVLSVPCAGGEVVQSLHRALDPGRTHHPDVGHQARQRPVVLRKPVALGVEPHGSKRNRRLQPASEMTIESTGWISFQP